MEQDNTIYKFSINVGLSFPVSYLFFVFISTACILLLRHHVLTSFLSLYQTAITV